MKWTLRSFFCMLLLTLFVSGLAAVMVHDKVGAYVLESSHDSRLQGSDFNDDLALTCVGFGIMADRYDAVLAAHIELQNVLTQTVRLPESRAPPFSC